MKKLSRLLALFLIIVMLATMSVSCKKQDDDDDEAVVSTDVETESGEEEKEQEDVKEEPSEKEEETSEKEQEGADSSKTEEKKESDGKKTESADKKTDAESKQEAIENAEQKGEGAGSYKESEDGTVIETGDYDVTEEYQIKEAVTNDNGFIPDEEQGLEKSERRATEASKYNFDENPLINRDRQVNKEAMPSFNIDDTGFVRAGTKLEDLKGKTLQFFTADNFAAWSYRNEKGETIDEWTWFKQLKSELGLNIKYSVKQHQASINAALQYMNAGKQCDVVYTNHNVQPQALCISRSITALVNINNLGSSPGVCKTTMDLCKWGNTLRLIAPIGVVDCIWYNQTLAQELNLSDPHTMWEKGVWDWDSFRKFMYSIPETTKDGRELVPWICFSSNIPFTWPQTNGTNYIEIVTDAEVPTVKNNWSHPDVVAAYEFICEVQNTVGFKVSSDRVNGTVPEHIGLYEGTTMMSATMYTQVYRDTEYSKHIQINWVPFPRANTDTGKECCQYYGFGMVLPRKTAKEDNVNAALKFMELWATRFTETLFDNLNTFEYYNFNYKQRKQYFDFVTQNVVFAPAFGGFYDTFGSTTNFYNALSGNAAYNIKTEIEKSANLASQHIEERMKYGN